MTSHPLKKNKADLVLRRGPTCINHPWVFEQIVYLMTSLMISISNVKEQIRLRPMILLAHVGKKGLATQPVREASLSNIRWHSSSSKKTTRKVHETHKQNGNAFFQLKVETRKLCNAKFSDPKSIEKNVIYSSKSISVKKTPESAKIYVFLY